MKTVITLILVAALAGCATTQVHQYQSIEHALVQVGDIAAIDAVHRYAADSIAQSRSHLEAAEWLVETRGDPAEVDHRLELARQFALLALEQARVRQAREVLAGVTIDELRKPPAIRLAGLERAMQPRIPRTAAQTEQPVRVALRLERALQPSP